MSDAFDPNDEPETEEQADAYINWCADNFMRLSQGAARTNRTAVRCAHWLLVVSVAQLHLDDEVQGDDREALMEQLAMYQQLARALERQRQHFAIERLIALRSSLDCWRPTGDWAGHLLAAAKCAVGALMLIELHLLIDLWELECPDVWAQIQSGGDYLGAINIADDLSFADFAVTRDEGVTSKFTWQRANNIVRHVGMGPLSAN